MEGEQPVYKVCWTVSGQMGLAWLCICSSYQISSFLCIIEPSLRMMSSSQKEPLIAKHY